MDKGIVNKIIKFSAVDGPGNRTVIFLQGCNFKCSYCHNPETINICTSCGICVKTCETNALQLVNNKINFDSELCTSCDNCINICPSYSSPKTQQYTVDELFKIILKAKPFISGITISGGECTVQYDFLKAILIRAKKENISAFIDTNGHLEPLKMQELSKYFDKAMLDIKSFAPKEHLKLTGKSNNFVLQNADFLLKSDKIYEIRTVIVSDFLENEKNVEEISKIISKSQTKVNYKIIKFRNHNIKSKHKLTEPSDKLMNKLKIIAEKNNCNCIVV